MKRIALEEHFSTPGHLDYLNNSPDGIDYDFSFVKDQLLDLGEGRIQKMDAAGIDMQVLSLVTPGVNILDADTSTAMARKVNDTIASVINKYPTRFVALASIACQDPQAAANELERAVRELGLKGACIDSHVNGEYLDNKKYWPIFKKAEQLDSPIYIHPRLPSPDMLKPYSTYENLKGAMWGFGAEVSLHALRLISSGLFDECPRLKIILGHLGEALPFWQWRLDNKWKMFDVASKLKKVPSSYLRDNFYITTSGMFYQPALLCALMAMSADKILFAVDYPFSTNEQAVDFMDHTQLNEVDREKIYHLNAEKLLKIS